jgi:hypothetical protein
MQKRELVTIEASFLILIAAILGVVYLNIDSTNKKVAAGLQECPRIGSSMVDWQKECTYVKVKL